MFFIYFGLCAGILVFLFVFLMLAIAIYDRDQLCGSLFVDMDTLDVTDAYRNCLIFYFHFIIVFNKWPHGPYRVMALM